MKVEPRLLSQKEVNAEFLKYFEDEDAEDNLVYNAWENGQFPSNCDDGDKDTFVSALSKLKETPIEAWDNNTQDGTVVEEFDKVLVIYKSLVELMKGQ